MIGNIHLTSTHCWRHMPFHGYPVFLSPNFPPYFLFFSSLSVSFSLISSFSFSVSLGLCLSPFLFLFNFLFLHFSLSFSLSWFLSSFLFRFALWSRRRNLDSCGYLDTRDLIFRQHRYRRSIHLSYSCTSHQDGSTSLRSLLFMYCTF